MIYLPGFVTHATISAITKTARPYPISGTGVRSLEKQNPFLENIKANLQGPTRRDKPKSSGVSGLASKITGGSPAMGRTARHVLDFKPEITV